MIAFSVDRACAFLKEVRAWLMLKAAAARGMDLETYRKIIDRAIGGGGYIDYYQMHDYRQGVDTAIDAMAELLDQGHADAVIELSEYALSGVEKAIEQVDDSDGYRGCRLPGADRAAGRVDQQ